MAIRFMRIDAILITGGFINREFNGVKSSDSLGSHNNVTPDKQHSLRKTRPNHFAASDSFKIFDLIHQRFRFPAVTNALSCCSSPAAVRPNPLTTAPVPFRKKAHSSRAAFQMPNDRRLSACGSATIVSLRLRSRRLFAYASLSRSPNRRPKLRCAVGKPVLMPSRTDGQNSRRRSSQICLPLSDFRRTIADMPKNALSWKE
jgi:hypothetical protein